MKAPTKRSADIDHPDECREIQEAFFEKGYDVTLEYVHEWWREYSREDYCAGWMFVPSKYELFRIIEMKFETE